MASLNGREQNAPTPQRNRPNWRTRAPPCDKICCLSESALSLCRSRVGRDALQPASLTQVPTLAPHSLTQHRSSKPLFAMLNATSTQLPRFIQLAVLVCSQLHTVTRVFSFMSFFSFHSLHGLPVGFLRCHARFSFFSSAFSLRSLS